MSASIRHFLPALAALSAFALNVVVCAAFAQTPAAPPASARVDVPDGAPELAAEKNVSNTSVTAPVKSSSSVIVEEERVQGRLANARISGSLSSTSDVDFHRVNLSAGTTLRAQLTPNAASAVIATIYTAAGSALAVSPNAGSDGVGAVVCSNNGSASAS